jgi:hypothetical protein
MTERKQLKKQLSKLKAYKRNLPRLIDCSTVYGDEVFTQKDYALLDERIKEIENKIAAIDENKEPASKAYDHVGCAK